MSTLNDLADRIHTNAVAHGFYEEERNFGEIIALMHSELSESLEEYRAGRPDVYDGESKLVDVPHGAHIIKPEGVAVELVDCMIRILDTLASMEIDIDALAERKMAYNATRPYKHGKKY